ncbi:MAG: hypothetical protein RRB13_13260 [bacterium]|nr:hypothetical protein [bacterium]
MKRFSLLLLSAMVLTLGACETKKKEADKPMVTKAKVGSVDCNKETFDKYIGEAEAALAKARSVGHEWVNTAKEIDTAKELAGQGRFDEACKDAHAGLLQGVMAYRQYEDNKNAGPRF